MPPSSVMVVDANPATARRIRQALRGTDLDLVAASSMDQAMEHAGDPTLVAIFSAVSIPGGNGYELTRRVVSHRPDLATFLLWGGFEAFDQDRAMVAGVRAGLRRPFSNEAVLALLEDAMGAVPVPSSSLEPVEPLEPLESLEEDLPVGSIEPLDITGAVQDGTGDALVPLVGNERLATFVPADYAELPPVRIDREEISVALERAVLAVLPEVLETLLAKVLVQPGRTRSAFQATMAQVVGEQLPDVVEQVLRERLDESK
jgi:CheY-like chemotaxis protein